MRLRSSSRWCQGLRMEWTSRSRRVDQLGGGVAGHVSDPSAAAVPPGAVMPGWGAGWMASRVASLCHVPQVSGQGLCHLPFQARCTPRQGCRVPCASLVGVSGARAHDRIWIRVPWVSGRDTWSLESAWSSSPQSSFGIGGREADAAVFPGARVTAPRGRLATPSHDPLGEHAAGNDPQSPGSPDDDLALITGKGVKRSHTANRDVARAQQLADTSATSWSRKPDKTWWNPGEGPQAETPGDPAGRLGRRRPGSTSRPC